MTIRQIVTVQAGGMIQLQLPELREGESAEIVVTTKPMVGDTEKSPQSGKWQKYVGIFHGHDPNASNNERIDADLAKEYGESLENT